MGHNGQEQPVIYCAESGHSKGHPVRMTAESNADVCVFLPPRRAKHVCLPRKLLHCSRPLSPELGFYLQGMRVYAQEQALRNASSALGM